jgi:membrane protease YdiL (CAAX protease family)
MHYAYGPGTLALIAVDGVVLGLARHRSGSLWVPAAMHALGNLISIGQSLTP